MRHSQSRALLRWTGKKCGLYPCELELEIDTVLECISDIQHSLVPAWYSHACGRSPVTGDFYEATKLSAEQVAGVFDALNNEILPVRFQQLENLLSGESRKSGPYFCGNVLTVADLSAYVLIAGMIDGTYLSGLSTEFVRTCTGLVKLVETVRARPQVQAWEAQSTK